MNAIGYFTAFAAIGGILALSTSYAERRNLKTWAPNAVVNTPKLVATTAVPSPKLAAAAVGSAAVQEPVLMASSPEPDGHCATAPDARSRRNQCAAEAGRGGRAAGSPSALEPHSQTHARGAALVKVASASKDLDPNPTDAGPALSGADPVQAR